MGLAPELPAPFVGMLAVLLTLAAAVPSGLAIGVEWGCRNPLGWASATACWWPP